MIEIYSRDALQVTLVEGTFLETVHNLNLAGAQGKQFVIFEEPGGNPVAIEAHNIIKIRSVDDDDSMHRFMGGS
jgi:hypothetical protein